MNLTRQTILLLVTTWWMSAACLGQPAPSTQPSDGDLIQGVAAELNGIGQRVSQSQTAQVQQIGQLQANNAQLAAQLSTTKAADAQSLANVQGKLDTANQQVSTLQAQVAKLAGYSPGVDLASILNNAKSGDDIKLNPGTYKLSGPVNFGTKINITVEAVNVSPATIIQSVVVPNVGTVPMLVPGADPTVTIDGSATATAITGGTQITLRGVAIAGCHNGLQQGALACATGYTLEDVVIQNCDTAGPWILKGSQNVTWTRVLTRGNGYLGYGGTGQHIKISMLLSLSNNNGRPTNLFGIHGVQVNGKWYGNPGWEAGGGKFSGCDDLTMDQCWAQDNGGPGNWFDAANTHIKVQNCGSVANRAVNHSYDPIGFMCEINAGPITYSNNITWGNNGGLVAAESNHITYTGNHVFESFYFRNMKDTENNPPKFPNGLRNGGLHDVTVSGNFFYGKAQLYLTALAAGYQAPNNIVTLPNTMNIAGPSKWVVGATQP